MSKPIVKHQPLASVARTPVSVTHINAKRDWKDLGLCAEVDSEIFFPAKGESNREAKRICRSCEVRAECLKYALANDERFGIWGGTSERERRRIKRQAVA